MNKVQSKNEPNFLEKVIDYFTRIDFYTDKELELGTNTNNIVWTILVYLLASLGIFGRQITNFPKKVSINFSNLQWNILFASLIFGFALLPFIIKQVNKACKKPGIEQIATAFGIGFFIDFTSNAVLHYYFAN